MRGRCQSDLHEANLWSGGHDVLGTSCGSHARLVESEAHARGRPGLHQEAGLFTVQKRGELLGPLPVPTGARPQEVKR